MFFIAVVILTLGALSLQFGTFNSFINQVHQNNFQANQQGLSTVTVGNASFGGVLLNQRGTVTGTLNAPKTRPLLPVSNMNFTGGLSGWSVSKGYSVLQHNATVTNQFTIPVNLTTIVNPTQFTLTVTDTDQKIVPYLSYGIAKVTLLVDTKLSLSGVLQLPTASWASCWTPACAGGPPSVTGNNITWVATAPFSLGPASGTQTFSWFANVPAVLDTYYYTVILSWILTSSPIPPPPVYVNSGLGTVNTTITTGPPSNPVSTANLVAAESRLNGATIVNEVIPGGALGGYDANALASSSESGPGNLYFNFQPTFNGTSIPSGQQLGATVNYTTTFALDPTTSPEIAAPGGCCALSWSSIVDNLRSLHNSLIYVKVYLQNPSGTYWVLNASNPTNTNYFGATDWIFLHAAFPAPVPAGWAWNVGTYRLIVSVSATLPGASLHTSAYPAVATMHFDDIGVTLKPLATTYYGSQVFQVKTGLNRTQVQGLELVVNMTGAWAETEAYAFLGDTSRFAFNPLLWTQQGSATFNSAGGITAVIPLPNAGYFLDHKGFLSVMVNFTTPSACPGAPPCNLQVSIGALFQTVIHSHIAISVQNPNIEPVHLVALYISGPNAIGTYTTSSAAPNNFDHWINGGGILLVAENYQWLPNQMYTVTVTTDTGLVYSRTFTAPVASA